MDLFTAMVAESQPELVDSIQLSWINWWLLSGPKKPVTGIPLRNDLPNSIPDSYIWLFIFTEVYSPHPLSLAPFTHSQQGQQDRLPAEALRTDVILGKDILVQLIKRSPSVQHERKQDQQEIHQTIMFHLDFVGRFLQETKTSWRKPSATTTWSTPSTSTVLCFGHGQLR